MNKAFKSVGVAALSILGAFLSRWHGGGFIKNSPKILKALLWSAPFAVGSGLAWLHSGFGWWSALCAALVLIVAMLGKNTGHGGGMDLGHSVKEPGAGRDPEKLEYLVLWLHGRIPRYWYDLVVLAVIGLASTIGAAVALGIINPWAAIPALLGGILGKPAGYAIGWAIYPNRGVGDGSGDFDEATEIGELLTGLFAYAGLGLGIWIAF